MSKRSLYRQNALEHYKQQREKDILPQLVSPPVFLCLWLLFTLMLTAGVVAWCEQVPITISAGGIILNSTTPSTTASQAVVFIPASQAAHLKVGMPISITILATGQQISTTIAAVQAENISPSAARQQYQLGDSAANLVPGPSVVVQVQLGAAVPIKTYAGSVLSANIQVGSQRLLSLLPGISGLIGG